ncbi:MAG: type I restriction enzyme HsdR N-terminal domain-containing protein [Clostridiales bacterium]|nr:type I restriction enzyme HsdR N-terminal domain-containing protein [Clostridiales bacterium]
MDKLNLPPAPLRIERREGQERILDPLRRRFVALTPEEWVRQHFVHFLIAFKGYPAGLMGNEVSITLNDTTRRCDTIVYQRDGQPWMIIEYKASTVAVTQRVFEQILRYNIVLQAPYLTVSNGKATYCCHIDHSTGNHTFLDDLPPYPVQSNTP